MVVVSAVPQPGPHDQIGAPVLTLPPGLQLRPHDQIGAPVLTLPPGLQLLADQVAAAPKLQYFRPRLAPRPALNFIPGPRSAPSKVRAQRMHIPVPVDHSGLVGGATLSFAPSPMPFASLIAGPGASVTNAVDLAPARRPPRKLGVVLQGLKGLPPVDVNKAQNIVDEWMSAASLAPGKSSLGAAHASDSMEALGMRSNAKVNDLDVMKALRAAAATNSGESVASESQLKSWLALTAKDSISFRGIDSEPRPVETSLSSLQNDRGRDVVEPFDFSVSPSSQQVIEETMGTKTPLSEAPLSSAKTLEAAAAVVLAPEASGEMVTAIVHNASTNALQQPLPLQPLQVSDSTGQELTGLDMLRAMAETKKFEGIEDAPISDAKRAGGGYAMLSMMHRAAENAKANMRSRMAAERSQSENKPVEGFWPEEIETLPPEAGFVYMGKIPKGTSEGLILAACAKFGTVTSLLYDAKAADIIEGAWALVKFAKQESATVAVSRMSRRSGLFGATESVEVRAATSEDVTRAEEHRKKAHVQQEEQIGEGLNITPLLGTGADSSSQPSDAQTGLDYKTHERDPKDANSKRASHQDKDDRDNKRKRSGRRHDRDRKRKREDRKERSRRRRRRRSSDSSESDGSGDKGGDGAGNARVAPAVPVVKEERKLRGLGGFGDGPSVETSKAFNSGLATNTGHPDEPGGGRQVGVRGCWAEFATPDNRSYYVNIINGAKQWPKPIGFDNSTKTGAAITRSAAKPANELGTLSNVFVGSLPHGLNDIIFRQIFEQFGRIVTMKVVPEQRYGFIKYSQVADAQKAIDVMNGSVLGGSPLIVKFANMDRNW